MKKRHLAMAALPILALDALALHDIFGGLEKDLFWEYATLYASAAVLAGLVVLAFSPARSGATKVLAILAGAVTLFLVLDWAALHDILKANEPGYRLEYTILAASVLFFGFVAVTAVKKKSA